MPLRYQVISAVSRPLSVCISSFSMMGQRLHYLLHFPLWMHVNETRTCDAHFSCGVPWVFSDVFCEVQFHLTSPQVLKWLGTCWCRKCMVLDYLLIPFFLPGDCVTEKLGSSPVYSLFGFPSQSQLILLQYLHNHTLQFVMVLQGPARQTRCRTHGGFCLWEIISVIKPHVLSGKEHYCVHTLPSIDLG